MAEGFSATLRGRSSVEVLANGWMPQNFMPNRSYAVGLNGASTPNLANALASSEIGARTGYFVSTAGGAAPSGQYAELHFKFSGEKFGLIFDLSAAYVGFEVGCMIDGVVYPVKQPSMLMPDTQAPFVQLPIAPYTYVADDLGAGVHHARLVFPAGAVTKSWMILGYLVDANAGYTVPPRGVNINRNTAVAVTTSAVTFPTGTDTPYRGYRGIIFTNTTASPITVTIQNSGGTAFWIKSIPANDVVTFDALGFLYDPVKLFASATGVNATLIGSN